MPKITVEEDDNIKEFECDEYWLFVQKNQGEDSYFQHKYKASKSFRGHVQSHVTLSNLAEYMDEMQNHEEYKEDVNNG